MYYRIIFAKSAAAYDRNLRQNRAALIVRCCLSLQIGLFATQNSPR